MRRAKRRVGLPIFDIDQIMYRYLKSMEPLTLAAAKPVAKTFRFFSLLLLWNSGQLQRLFMTFRIIAILRCRSRQNSWEFPTWIATRWRGLVRLAERD